MIIKLKQNYIKWNTTKIKRLKVNYLIKVLITLKILTESTQFFKKKDIYILVKTKIFDRFSVIIQLIKIK